MPVVRCALALSSCFQNGMVVAWHGRGMAHVNQTRPHCVNQVGKTQSKPLAARHGRGMAGAAREWHGMCELALTHSDPTSDLVRHYDFPVLLLFLM
jgi:hypothetical protein